MKKLYTDQRNETKSGKIIEIKPKGKNKLIQQKFKRTIEI